MATCAVTELEGMRREKYEYLLMSSNNQDVDMVLIWGILYSTDGVARGTETADCDAPIREKGGIDTHFPPIHHLTPL